MRPLILFGAAMALALTGCGSGSTRSSSGLRTFGAGSTTLQTGQATVEIGPGSTASSQVSVTWVTAFSGTNYTVVCTPKMADGTSDGLSTVIAGKSATGVQVLIQSSSSGTVEVNCLAVADSANIDLRYARASFSSSATNQPSVQSLTWNTSLPDMNYTAVCSVVATVETEPVTEHLHATTSTEITTWVNFVTSTVRPFEVDCVGIPDNSASTIRRGRTEIVKASSSPIGIFVSWNTPFSDTNYVPVCDTQFVSGTELSITTDAGASTTSNQSVTVSWSTNDGRGIVHCIAVSPADLNQGSTTPTRPG